MTEQAIGKVTHFYNHLNVAAIRLQEGELTVGDTIHVKGHTSDFLTRVASMEVAHQPVFRVGPGSDVGIRVTGHAHEHDMIYKVA